MTSDDNSTTKGTKQESGNTEEKASKDFSRRRFLYSAATLTAASIVGCKEEKSARADRWAKKNPSAGKTPAIGEKEVQSPETLLAQGSKKGKKSKSSKKSSRRGHVWRAQNSKAWDNKKQPAQKPIEKMLDDLIKELTGKSKPADAWATLFKSTDIVALKPNTLGRDWISPSPALVETIIAKLGLIGITADRILTWDRSHFASTDLYKTLKKGPIQVKLQDDWGFEANKRNLATAGKVRLTKAITKATAVINIPVCKDHGTAGVTGALKNMSHGSIQNPWDHHSNGCNPSIPEIYDLSHIKDKVRLVITDGFRMVYDGGPSGMRSRRYNISHSSLYLSTDPVAMDRVLWHEIDRVRKNKGKQPLMKRGSKSSGRPIHVLHADKIGLGESTYSSIKYKKV